MMLSQVAAQTVTFTATWSHTHMRTLRGLLLQRSFFTKIRTVLTVLLTQYAVFGVTSPVAHAVTGGLTLLFQYGAHTLGSLIIVPAQRRSHAMISKLVHSPTVRRYIPNLADALGPVMQALGRLQGMIGVERERLFRDHPGGQRVSIHTPDGCVLDGAFFRAHAGTRVESHLPTPAERGVVVYFGGNGEHYETRRDLLFFRSWGLAVMMMNYRGVGESTGSTTRDGLITDAASVLTFLIESCGFPEHRIIVIGHSIGGAIATEAARAFPKVLLVHDRSFGTLTRTAMFHLGSRFAHGPDARTYTGLTVRYMIYLLVKYGACWEMDSVKNWRHIGPNRYICFAPDDAIIPLPAQLYSQLQEDWSTPSPECPVLRMESQGRGSDSHNRNFTRDELQQMYPVFDAYLRAPPR